MPQEKYFIYFKDKGIEPNLRLDKNSIHFQQALIKLSPRAVERRKKHLGDDFINFKDVPINDYYIEVLKDLGITVKNKLDWFNAVSAYLTNTQLNQVQKLSFVKSTKPVKKLVFRNQNSELFKQHIVNTDSINSRSYGASFEQLNLSDIPLVHAKGITGEGVIIGLLDSGYDWQRHESLSSRNVIKEYDFVFGDTITANQPEDVFGQDFHGTLIFSIIGGFKDSTMIGAAYNSGFLLAKTEDIRSETNVEEDNYAAALIWMENYGVDITSSSLGYNIFDAGNFSYSYSDMNGQTTIVTQALQMAFERGVSTFTSAGNEGNSGWYHIIAPGDGFSVITVGAIDNQKNIASFSSRGPTFDGRIKPEVVAQGVSVFGASANTTNGYGYASGTSTSAPIASGVGALLLSKFPHLINTQIRSIILNSSDNSSSPNNNYGYGLISAKNAIEFPNLEEENGIFSLNKMFFDEIDSNSTKLQYSLRSNPYQDLTFNEVHNSVYKFILPQFSDGEAVTFYFSGIDSSGNQFRLPESGNYQFEYGSLEIKLILENPLEKLDYRISDIYPNPFTPAEHKKTKLNFRSAGNEMFKLSIIDGAGQKVKSYNVESVEGENYIEWDGYSDRGYLCASGVYYFLMELSGEKFGRKLILLK